MTADGVVHLRIEPAAPLRLCRDAAEATACGPGAAPVHSDASPAQAQGPRTVSLSLQRAIWVEDGRVRHEEVYCGASSRPWSASGDDTLRFSLHSSSSLYDDDDEPLSSVARRWASFPRVDIASLTLKSAHDLAPWLAILARRAATGLPGIREICTGADAVGVHMLERLAAVAGSTLESLETVVEAATLDVFTRFDWSLFPRLKRLDVCIVCPHPERSGGEHSAARGPGDAPPAYWEAMAFPTPNAPRVSSEGGSLPPLDTLSVGIEICAECHLTPSSTPRDPLGALPAENLVGLPAATLAQLGEQLSRFGSQCTIFPSFFFQEGVHVAASERKSAHAYQKLLEDDLAVRRRAAASTTPRRLNLSDVTLIGGHAVWGGASSPVSPAVVSN